MGGGGQQAREGRRPGKDLGLSHEQREPWRVLEQERNTLFGMFQGTSPDLSSVLSSFGWDGETHAGGPLALLGGFTVARRVEGGMEGKQSFSR